VIGPFQQSSAHHHTVSARPPTVPGGMSTTETSIDDFVNSLWAPSPVAPAEQAALAPNAQAPLVVEQSLSGLPLHSDQIPKELLIDEKEELHSSSAGSELHGFKTRWDSEKGAHERAGVDGPAADTMVLDPCLLLDASRFGRTGEVRRLVADGASLAVTDRVKATPLHLASRGLGAAAGHLASVQLLLDAGANAAAKDILGLAPLHYAAIKGCEEVAKILLGSTDVAAQTNDGWTALHFAASKSQLGTAALLLHAGADIASQNSSGNTALHLAVYAARPHPADQELMVRRESSVLTTYWSESTKST